MCVRRAVCDQERNTESESAQHSFTGGDVLDWPRISLVRGARRVALRTGEERTSIAYAMNAWLQLRCQADLKGKHLRNDGFLVGGSDSGL